MILLDTHIWLWWLLGDGNLTPQERLALDGFATKKQMAISWVSIWETEMLERKGRIVLKPGFNTWIRKATDNNICTTLGVDADVVIAQRALPENFHNDPADRLICATAVLADIPLATKDQQIIRTKACRIWQAV